MTSRLGRWTAIDAVAVPVTAVLATLAWPAPSIGPGLGWFGGVVTVLLLLLSAAGRRRLPPPVLGIAAVAASAAGPSPAAVVAATFLMYAAPARLPRIPAVIVLAAGGVGALVAADGYLGLTTRPARAGAGAIAVPALVVMIGWVAGYGLDRQRRYSAVTQRQEALAARELLAAERQALAEERLTIAREVHDVVAHTLAVITVQAGVAQHVAAEYPDEAQRALGSIVETSRVALGEMRSLLGVLRTQTPAEESTEPAPGLDAVAELLRRCAEAGLRVDLTVEGEPVVLAAGPSLAAHRVIQEALTNVLKHARTDCCALRLAYRPSTLIVEVTDDGAGGEPAGGGHGLAGMRERLAMYGGGLTAGPRPGGGFGVTAVLPTATPG
jgi:signal transduction histidine kinase